MTISSATANLLLTDNDTRVLQNPRIRATDGQKADLKVGSKIPIATGSYQTGAATAVVSSLVNTQFQYQDVGVEIEITPTIHYDRDVTLKLKMAISQESGFANLSGIQEPIFSQRTVDQTIRLKEGEASIMGGLLQTKPHEQLFRYSRAVADSAAEVSLQQQRQDSGPGRDRLPADPARRPR